MGDRRRHGGANRQVPSAQRYSTAVGGQSEDFQQYGTGSDEAYCLGYSLGKHTSGAEDFFFNLCSELYLPTAFQVLKIQPNNEKALFRKAKILQEKHQLDEAIGFHSKLGFPM